MGGGTIFDDFDWSRNLFNRLAIGWWMWWCAFCGMSLLLCCELRFFDPRSWRSVVLWFVILFGFQFERENYSLFGDWENSSHLGYWENSKIGSDRKREFWTFEPEIPMSHHHHFHSLMKSHCPRTVGVESVTVVHRNCQKTTALPPIHWKDSKNSKNWKHSIYVRVEMTNSPPIHSRDSIHFLSLFVHGHYS